MCPHIVVPVPNAVCSIAMQRQTYLVCGSFAKILYFGCCECVSAWKRRQSTHFKTNHFLLYPLKLLSIGRDSVLKTQRNRRAFGLSSKKKKLKHILRNRSFILILEHLIMKISFHVFLKELDSSN